MLEYVLLLGLIGQQKAEEIGAPTPLQQPLRDVPQPFHVVNVPMHHLGALYGLKTASPAMIERIKAAPSGVVLLSFTVENKEDLKDLYANTFVTSPQVDWRNGEVLVCFVLALHKPREIHVVKVQWPPSGKTVSISYRLGKGKKAIAFQLGGKAIEPDYVDQVIGVVTVRPRPQPTVVLSESK